MNHTQPRRVGFPTCDKGGSPPRTLENMRCGRGKILVSFVWEFLK